MFSQFLDFIDKDVFLRIADRYGGNHYVKHFTCWNQLAVLMFGQLYNRESLRDVVLATQAHWTVKDYVGYLAGLHCISNGDNYFTSSYELRGVPDWADNKGTVHIKQDAWNRSIQEKCIKKLNLTYDILNVDIEEDDLNSIINENSLIVDETFYYDMKRFLPEKEQPLWDEDDLPF